MVNLKVPTGIQHPRRHQARLRNSMLTSDAINFLAELARRFTARRDELLRAREERQAAIDGGALPDYLPETAAIRDDRSWRVAPVPADSARSPCRNHRAD